MSCCGKQKVLDLEDEEIIQDHFNNFSEIKDYLSELSAKEYDIVFYLDFSKSNIFDQTDTLLHTESSRNPYLVIIEATAAAAAELDSDQQFSAYRFGDSESKHLRVVPLYQDQATYTNIDDLMLSYTQTCQEVTYCGPVQLSKCFEHSINHSIQNPGKHIISVIITNSESQSEIKDVNALKIASYFPISFCCLGVGSSPFSNLQFYDNLQGRNVDNFQFAQFTNIQKKLFRRNIQESKLIQSIGCQIFMEVPIQVKQMENKRYYEATRTVKIEDDNVIVRIQDQESIFKLDLKNLYTP